MALPAVSMLDEELLLQARSGVPEAMGQLYDRHHALVYGIALGVSGDPTGAADAVLEAFRALPLDPDGHLAVKVRLARAARDAVLSSGIARRARPGSRDPLSDAQRAVVDLAHTHRLPGTDIATVLRLDIRDVRRLANEGLTALAVARRS